MARQEKKLQSSFTRKLSSKYTKRDSGVREKTIEGLFGSSKFIDWVFKCKEGAKSIDFAFIGDSNNASGNTLDTNFTNAQYTSYGTTNPGNNTTFLNAWGYINGFANALLNNNFNLYGGPVEPAVATLPVELTAVSAAYGGSGSGSPAIGAVQGVGVSHYLTQGTIPNANDTDYAVNAGVFSLPEFKIKPRGKTSTASLNNLSSNNLYKFHNQGDSTVATNKIIGVFAKNYFGDSYINQFNSEKSPLSLARQRFETADGSFGGLMPYFFGPEYELQGNLNSAYAVGSNNPLLLKSKLKYRTLVWESSESNGYFPMSMFYGDTTGGVISPFVFGTATTDAMGSLSDVSGTDLRGGINLCRFFKGKLIIDPTKTNMNEQISFVIQKVSKNGIGTSTAIDNDPLLYNAAANGFNLRTRQIRENGFCKIVDKGGNNFTLYPYGHSHTDPKIEGFYNQSNTAGRAEGANRTRNITAANLGGNPQRVYLKLTTAIAGTTVSAGTPIQIAADSLIQADMLNGYPAAAFPIFLSSVSTNTGAVIVNGTALSSANPIGIVAVNIGTNTVTFDKAITIAGGVSEIVFTSNDDDRIPVLNVFSKQGSWNARTSGAAEGTNEPYIMKNASGNDITTRTIFDDVIVEYCSTTTCGIHNYSTSPRSGRPQNTQIRSQLATKNNLIPNSQTFNGFSSDGSVTETSLITITNSLGTAYTNLTAKNMAANLDGIKYIVPNTQLYAGVNEFYYDTVSNSTFSIWVKFTGTNAKLGISLQRESDNAANTSNGTLSTWADPSVLGAAGATSQSATCIFVEKETGSTASSSDFTITQVGNNWSTPSSNHARFVISANGNGVNTWVRFSVNRSDWFTTVRVANITGSAENISVALPQLETFPSASANILTTGTASKSIGRWAPREAEYTIKFEQQEFNALSPTHRQLIYPPSFLYFSHDFWGTKWRKGPYSIALQSVYSDGYGFSISSLFSMSGGKVFDSNTTNTHDFYKGVLECTPQGSNSNNTTLRTIFKEYRSRQLSATSNDSGNVCIMIQGGINDAASSVPATDFVENIKKLTNLLHAEWAALGYPPSDFHVVFMISHNRGKEPDDTRMASYASLLIDELYADKNFYEKLSFINTQQFVSTQELIDNVCYEYTANSYCDPNPDTIINASQIVQNKLYRIESIAAGDFTTIGAVLNTVGTVFKATASNPSTFGNSTVVELLTGKLGTPNYGKPGNNQLLHLHKKGYNFIANRIISRVLSAK